MPNWADSPSDSDIREFYGYMRKLASEHGDVEEFSAADKDGMQNPPIDATDRFVESGNPGMPVKPVR